MYAELEEENLRRGSRWRERREEQHHEEENEERGMSSLQNLERRLIQRMEAMNERSETERD